MKTSDTAAYAYLDNYEVTAYNSTLQDPDGDNRWIYDLRIDISIDPYDNAAATIPNARYAAALNGYWRGQKWDGSSQGGGTLVNDETWTMNHLVVAVDHQGPGKPDIISASGGAAYLGSVREGDNEHNGMRLSIDFDRYTFLFNPVAAGSQTPLDIQIGGKVKASCHPAWAIYSTTENLIDDPGVRDSRGDRMSSTGEMRIGVSNKDGLARATFGINSGTDKAQVTIMSDTYPSWRNIIEGSSCEIFQDIIDRVLP
jgi:hypothetical protein